MQLDRDVYQETQKKTVIQRQRKLEILRDQQTHQHLKPREREIGSERDFDRLRDIKRGNSKSQKYPDPESMEEVQRTEGKGAQSSSGEWRLNLTEIGLR